MIKFIKSLFAEAEINKPFYIAVAEAEIGVHEVKGGENPRIIEYDKATSLQATEDEVPWCSSFVNWVMKRSGFARTHSAAARSWLGYGPVSKKFQKYWIVVFARGNDGFSGHVAFAIDDHGDYIRVLGGNQHDSVCYADFKKDRILGYVQPHKDQQV